MAWKGRAGKGFALADQRDREVGHPRVASENRTDKRFATIGQRDGEIRHPQPTGA